MRISTNTIYSEGISRITSIQEKQVKLQEQISTGKRFNSPSEDPVAAARALDISYAMDVNKNYADTRKTAQNYLNSIEGNLQNVTDLITSAQSVLVSSGNATLGDTERKFKANELQNKLDAILGIANTQDASGKFMFAGFKTDTKPFTATATGATYNGNSNELLLQVDSQRLMPANAAGDSVFQANGTDVFSALTDIINLLNTPITNSTEQATFNTGLTTAIGKMKSGLDNVLNVRAKVGAQLDELDKLNDSGSALDLQYQTALSEIQDLDYAQALSDVSKYETIMEAAQKTFTATSQLSLFNFM